ncbi:cellulose biosynthesis protein BcsE [Paraburkholderia sp.]|uniref:cellulose biosynthesis protein BcsE n=1 Tax=Paraburkholderia sp. TaxID=1926495 RepID=UPI002F42C313
MPNPTTRSPTARAARAVARRWRHLLGRGAQRGEQAGRLAIDALPPEWAALETGKLYAIYAAPRTPGADALIWESARDAYTRDVTIVLARSRAQVTRQLRERGFSTDAPAVGWPRNLSVLAMPPGADHGKREADGDDPNTEISAGSAGAAATRASTTPGKLFGGLRALKRLGLRAHSLYFVEGAQRWFSWDDAAALAREGRLLANWCAARRVTLVLLLGGDAGEADAFDAQPAPDAAAALPGSNAFHAACAGVAHMGHTHGELLWHVDFWRAERTLVTGEVRALRFSEGGRLSVAPDAPTAATAHGERLLAHDEQRVVVSRAVVRGHEAWVPPQWEVCADQQAVLAACATARAATVVLDYLGGAQLEALCAAVHTLRRRAGRALKIVIVERGEVLRHQYELLVLTLGANLVLGRGLPFSRMQSRLQSLQGQLHTRAVAADYRSALSAALSDDVCGYLPAGAFIERVRSVLERSAVLNLPHVLVKLTLLPQCAHVDALTHCAPRRAGDLVTTDAAHLYVFLFACRLADADAALARIFDVPVEQLADLRVHLAEASIGAELDALEAENRRARLADYSDMFARSARGELIQAGPAARGQAAEPQAGEPQVAEPQAGEAPEVASRAAVQAARTAPDAEAKAKAKAKAEAEAEAEAAATANQATIEAVAPAHRQASARLAGGQLEQLDAALAAARAEPGDAGERGTLGGTLPGKLAGKLALAPQTAADGNQLEAKTAAADRTTPSGPASPRRRAQRCAMPVRTRSSE